MENYFKKEVIDDNTSILKNFQSIKVTPNIKPILKLQCPQTSEPPFQIPLEIISNPDFENIDEKTNNYVNRTNKSCQTKKGLAKFRAAAKKIIESQKKIRKEEVIIEEV